MSLDVYICGPLRKQTIVCHECGHQHEVEDRERFFDANITHNLGRMAAEAGIYDHLWRPEELGITHAKELIEPLKKGLELLKSDPQKFEKFSAINGWGTYKQFIPWVEEYLAACIRYPDGFVEASR